MAWTFRKRKKLFPGVRLNYGSSGLSLNLGVPGASVTVGANGVYANTGIPGTGIRNRKKLSSTTSTENINDVQLTEKDIKRIGCIINWIHFIGYTFSYAIIVILWIVTGYTYSTENHYYLIPAIIDALFIVNTIRMHLYHHRTNTTSTLTFPIVFTILSMIFVSICGAALYFQDEFFGWTLCVLLDIIWIFNLYFCFKYRVKPHKRETKKEDSKPVFVYSDGTTSEEHLKQLHERIAAGPVSERKQVVQKQPIQQNIPQQVNKPNLQRDTKAERYAPLLSIIQEPTIDYTKESVLSFSDRRVRDELGRTYSPELIKICAYVVDSERCILSDIQVSTGFSYQKVLESVKLLEKTRIVKEEGNRRKVMVTDETIAIRLLLRYAKERKV